MSSFQALKMALDVADRALAEDRRPREVSDDGEPEPAYTCECGWSGDEPDSKQTHPGCRAEGYWSPPDEEPACPICGELLEV